VPNRIAPASRGPAAGRRDDDSRERKRPVDRPVGSGCTPDLMISWEIRSNLSPGNPLITWPLATWSCRRLPFSCSRSIAAASARRRWPICSSTF